MGAFEDTPFRVRFAGEASLDLQPDTSKMQEVWFSVFAVLTALPVLTTGIFGRLGVLRPSKVLPLRDFLSRFRKYPGGLGEQWHGRYAPLQLAERGQMKDRGAANAPFNCAFAKHIHRRLNGGKKHHTHNLSSRCGEGFTQTAYAQIHSRYCIRPNGKSCRVQISDYFRGGSHSPAPRHVTMPVLACYWSVGRVFLHVDRGPWQHRSGSWQRVRSAGRPCMALYASYALVAVTGLC